VFIRAQIKLGVNYVLCFFHESRYRNNRLSRLMRRQL
jgi:hypothetical protein